MIWWNKTCDLRQITRCVVQQNVTKYICSSSSFWQVLQVISMLSPWYSMISMISNVSTQYFPFFLAFAQEVWQKTREVWRTICKICRAKALVELAFYNSVPDLFLYFTCSPISSFQSKEYGCSGSIPVHLCKQGITD